jgi:energy-coupling factor transporter ATP-binding protein EcfA2
MTAHAITLTEDQQNALEAFHNFLMDPIETVFVLRGYSGCGKSTLVRTLLDRLPGFNKTARLVNPNHKEYEVALTATTNKAAENLGSITGHGAVTIHSFLELRVSTDYRTNTTTLVPRNADQKTGYLLFIDEASYVDKQLLSYIFKKTANCKIVFIGDPAQLTPVKSVGTPVFDANFTGAALTTVVRQAEGNPIVDLSTKFRHTVNTGEFFSFKPDGKHVVYLSREDFNQAIEAEFTRPEWRYQDSKILAWTNKCVIGYNHFVRNLAKGDPHFQVDDYAVCNSFLTVGRSSIKTDQLVQITNIGPDYSRFDVPGNDFQIDHAFNVFMPKSLQDKNARIKKARQDEDFHLVSEMESQWADLRAAYACTINKAQGSTFDRVFVDLDDIRRCNSGDQIARMLYVGVSRARTQVFLTGDLV